MKKLMIAAAIVCAAALSQAATVNWTVKNITGPNGETMSAGTGYIYIWNNKGGDYTSPTALAKELAACKTVEAFTAILDTATVGLEGALTGTGGAAYSNIQLTDTGLPQSSSSTTAGARIFAVIIDSAPDGITADTKYYVTGTSGTQTIPKTSAVTSISWTLDAASSSTKENWKAAVAVPEPTSGLLLLLGVAGLALRRRRA